MEAIERASRIDLCPFEQGAKAYMDNPEKAKRWLDSIPFEPQTNEYDQFVEGVAAAEHGQIDAYSLARIDMAKRNAGGLTDDQHIEKILRKTRRLAPSASDSELEAVVKSALSHFRKYGL